MARVFSLIRWIGHTRPFKGIYRRIGQFQEQRLPKLFEAWHQRSNDPEVLEILAVVRSGSWDILPVAADPPYPFVDEYRRKEVKVYREPNAPHPYVELQGSPIYFPAEYSDHQVQEAVRRALLEQDHRSPHAYLAQETDVVAGDVAVLAGASDGIFCLSLIDKLSAAYLFEPDDRWLKPLERTLSPWREKVTIIPKFLSDHDSSNSVSLDSFWEGRTQELNFLQADVEGDEGRILRGGARTLRRSGRIRVAICCYHRPEDPSRIPTVLAKLGFATGYSRGYFIVAFPAPYLRRGVVYGWKGNLTNP